MPSGNRIDGEQYSCCFVYFGLDKSSLNFVGKKHKLNILFMVNKIVLQDRNHTML